MNPLFISWFALTVLSLLVGAGVYGIVRALEKSVSHEIWPLTVVVLMPVLLLGMWGSGWLLVMLCVVGAVGAYFHRKSGGVSPHGWAAFFLMTCAAVIALFLLELLIEVLPFSLRSRQIPRLWANYYWRFLLLCLFVPVALAPFLLWAYQKLWLRPGVDRGFNDDEMVA